jgi:DNA-binding transcriptional LysR family regulator
MELLRGLLPFLYTAREKSFRKAAERLGVTPAAVSKAVQALEDELGARLLHRTSRRVALTTEGELFLVRCSEAVAQLQAGRDAVTSAKHRPQGKLALSLSPILARPLLAALGPWARRYPEVSVELRVTDRLARLSSEDVDIALRVGAPEEGVVARKLRETRWVTLAGPSYLARYGTPRKPDDLAGHNCVRFVTPRGAPRAWTFLQRGKAAACDVTGTLSIDQGEMLLDAASSGLGLCQVLDFMAAPPLREGRVVEILGEFAAPGPSIYALFLPERRVVPKVRAFVEHLEAHFSDDEAKRAGPPRLSL